MQENKSGFFRNLIDAVCYYSHSRMRIDISFDGNHIMKYRVRTHMNKCKHFIPFIIDLHNLINKIGVAVDSGARYLVDQGHMEKEGMRKLWEKSIRESIDELNKLLDTVKLDEAESVG